MALQAGTTLGPYRIDAPLGAGGMGEVYQATDTRLDRTVAIKVLPAELASDPERRERFEREAKTISSLNHPHICTLYDVGHQDGIDFLVMEHLEGETLQDRLTKGALPLDQALRYAIEIADALDKAHRQGIVHRDLKPGNIMLTKVGAKLLDFGLAKLRGPAEAAGGLSALPTQEANLTAEGSIVGTFQYMAPEQLEGGEADARTDIWAFGCVVYEMVTGTKAFEEKSQASLIAAIIEREPAPVSSVGPMTPIGLDYVVNACLAKAADDRWQSARDLVRELERVASGGGLSTESAVTVQRPSLSQRSASVAGIVLGTAVVTGFAVWNLTPAAPMPVVRMPIPLGPDETFTGNRAVAISPDGSGIVYATTAGLAYRPVSELQATLMAGTRGSGGNRSGRSPFFSPDGQWVGYWQQGQLRKVAVTGGAPITLCEAESPYGASWGTNDTILYGQGQDGIWQVPATGGTPEHLISVEDGKLAESPQMLPGGEVVLYTLAMTGQWDDAQIVVEHLVTSERTVLIEGGRDGRYLPTGHLVYALGNALLAVSFDTDRLEVTGEPVSLVEGVRATRATAALHFSIADNGAMVYIPARSTGGSAVVEPVWVNRSGETEPVGAEPRAYRRVRVSPDGARLAVEIAADDGNDDIWTYDLARDTLTRLTFDEAPDDYPLWSLDGSRVVFSSEREGGGLFWKAADGTGGVERLLEGLPLGGWLLPDGWTADGRIVADHAGGIGVVTAEGDGTLELLLEYPEFTVSTPAMSPDGRWIAYSSRESGEAQVYVQPFPDLEAGRWQVSTGGGSEPVWSQDGEELFFTVASAQVWVASVTTNPTFRSSTPQALFDLTPFAPVGGREWDVAPDGNRFIFFRRVGDQIAAGPEGLVFVQNWHQELLERVPVS